MILLQAQFYSHFLPKSSVSMQWGLVKELGLAWFLISKLMLRGVYVWKSGAPLKPRCRLRALTLCRYSDLHPGNHRAAPGCKERLRNHPNRTFFKHRKDDRFMVTFSRHKQVLCQEQRFLLPLILKLVSMLSCSPQFLFFVWKTPFSVWGAESGSWCTFKRDLLVGGNDQAHFQISFGEWLWECF